ncbi:hypothetical protein F503_06612 [Ophiostoma piceae UAMH 11346]|uniref:Uncharacterized protein n=1 Tax=Ophiostoma piceae (strain UAMH 11346) TaxID=1262450 RepID=S3BQ23_OPHP1|nr:hypothetical protein F503_06612 [Ophiostoma piceae UAMH 11346]
MARRKGNKGTARRMLARQTNSNYSGVIGIVAASSLPSTGAVYQIKALDGRGSAFNLDVRDPSASVSHATYLVHTPAAAYLCTRPHLLSPALPLLPSLGVYAADEEQRKRQVDGFEISNLYAEPATADLARSWWRRLINSTRYKDHIVVPPVSDSGHDAGSDSGSDAGSASNHSLASGSRVASASGSSGTPASTSASGPQAAPVVE